MKRLNPLEAVELVILHCDYCHRMQRAGPAGKDIGVRKLLDSVNRRLFIAMTGKAPTTEDVRRMRFT